MTTRRSFLAAASAAALASCAPFVRRSAARSDLIIRRGTIIDGTGRAGFEADLLIHEGVIREIGPRLRSTGVVEIDARGLVVSPGFVDVHSHGDGNLFLDPMGESLIRQGVTTIVVGQDGSSLAPREIGSGPGGYDSIAALLAAVDALPSAVNVATMVGLGTLRGAVVGAANRPATPDEISRMTALVEAALRDGACGASTGLEYAPGAFATTGELIALCRPLAARALPYATHMRNEDDTLVEAVDESIAVARGAGCPLQIAHLKTSGVRNFGKIDTVFARIDAARGQGMDVTFDRYPYDAYSTGLSNMFPVWALDGGHDAFLARLADPATAPRIREYSEGKAVTIGGWGNVLISGVSNEADRLAEGGRLGELASAAGTAPYDFAVGLLQRNKGSVGTVVFAMSEDNLKRFLSHPLCMVCSDGGSFAVSGPARRGHPHPRGLGTFPRVLGRYVRETKTLSLESAVRKMSALSAERVRLKARGRLAPGYAADVVVFDAATIEDKATYADPFQYPAGISLVVVNGAISLRDGERMPARSGRALRSGM